LSSKDEIAKIYQVLSNPLRQRIIEFLGSRGKASVTEIKRALKISTGSLYYNLDLLGDLIYRDVDKKYSLTELGWIAFNMLKNGRESILDAKFYRKYSFPFKLRSRFGLIFHPRWIFMTFSEMKNESIIISLFILAFGSWLCAYTKTELTLFTVAFRPMQPAWITAIKFILSWLAIYGLANLIPFLLHGRVGGYRLLFTGLALSTIPLLICPALTLTQLFNNNYYLLSIVMFIAQIIACLLFSAAIGVAKNLRSERALLIGFLIAYLNITIVIFFRG